MSETDIDPVLPKLRIADNDAEYEEEDQTLSMQSPDLTDRQIEKVFDLGRFRLHQDRNDFMLPQVLDFIEKRMWLNIRPEYQRRLRWDTTKKSRLIESFLMNVPIPPVFLYENDVNRYEVMDGQQRLNSVIEYYSNQYDLRGLKVWSSLNGKRFSDLPPRIRRGLDRAKISAIILVADPSESGDRELGDIRTQVFERLNTGGVSLNAQELRNCVYASSFNDLVNEIASDRLFTDAWRIPAHKENIRDEGFVSLRLRRNNLYKSMKDCEIVLRFFAFRKEENIKGSVRSILDRCMDNNRSLAPDEIDNLRRDFFGAISLAVDVFGANAFCLAPNERGVRYLSRPLYDAVMVTFDRLSDRRDEIGQARDTIIADIDNALSDPTKYEVIVGRPNTAEAIRKRITGVFEIIRAAID